MQDNSEQTTAHFLRVAASFNTTLNLAYFVRRALCDKDTQRR